VLLLISNTKFQKNKIIFKKKKDFLNLCRIQSVNIVFIFINYAYFYLNNLFCLSTCRFHFIKTKGGDVTEKNSKMLILEISRNIIYLLIH